MDSALRAIAESVRAAMPCSVELPAGAGKTQLVAALAAIEVERQERPLVLTHTNAGVDAMRRRIRSFGVNNEAVRVATIASWSYELVYHYPQLAGLVVQADPDWSRSGDYYRAAAEVVQATAIRMVIQASYGCIIVDEYQDCSTDQHELVVRLAHALPICVFGDPLQNIFSFGGTTTVSWSNQVTAQWPAFAVPIKAWRWEGHNKDLGQWLLDVRADLYAGRSIDLTTAPLDWWQAIPGASVSACLDLVSRQGSIVAIDKWANNCASVAARTNGAYGMMEEFDGKFMMD
jgi:hypothetical protein